MCEVYEIRQPFGVLLLGGRVSGFGRPLEGRQRYRWNMGILGYHFQVLVR